MDLISNSAKRMSKFPKERNPPHLPMMNARNLLKKHLQKREDSKRKNK
jgi:hypothetical protein